MPWDIFLAHASPDEPTARALHDSLVGAGRRVFLDAVVLKPGDIWPRELARAQRSSRVTLALWSRKADAAWFLQDEVQTAITLCREPGGEHRLIVVFADGRPGPGEDPFYGTRILHSLDLQALGVAGVVGEIQRVFEEPAPVLSSPPAPDPDRHLAYNLLCALLPGQFDELVVIYLAPIAHLVAEPPAARSTRALHVLNAAGAVGGASAVVAVIRAHYTGR